MTIMFTTFFSLLRYIWYKVIQNLCFKVLINIARNHLNMYSQGRHLLLKQVRQFEDYNFSKWCILSSVITKLI